MFRSVAVAFLFMIFPSFALAQEVVLGQQATHEVVKGETLWSLAERYLGNPFRWPLIYDANTSQIQDPDLLEPGQLLVIPGVGGEAAQVHGVMVITQAGVTVSEEEIVAQPARVWVQSTEDTGVPCPGPDDRTLFSSGGEQTRSCPPIVPPTEERTSFYSQPVGGSVGGSRGNEAATDGVTGRVVFSTAAVPRGLFYTSDWLVEPGEEIGFIGTLAGFSQVRVERIPQGPARSGERLQITSIEGASLGVGDLLQSFRPKREEKGFGTVLRPTGILVVTAVNESEIIAMVSSEFERIRVGDRVRFAPDYTLSLDVFPLPVESNVTATILGFSEIRQIQSVGSTAFLDVGEAEGISVGDIFRAYVDQPGPFFGMESARLQVVLVNRNRSTARVVGLTHPALASGDHLRLIQKMQ